MKTSIIISGQIGGNFTLKAAVGGAGLIEVKNRMFNSFELVYETKKAAKKALREGYKHIRYTEDNPGRLTYNKFGQLYYDASKAELA